MNIAFSETSKTGFLATRPISPRLIRHVMSMPSSLPCIFIQTTSIRISKTQMLMDRSILDHCAILKRGEGEIED